MDLNLVHTNFLVDYPRLTAPNTKYVGGMHIRDGEDHYQLSRFETRASNSPSLFTRMEKAPTWAFSVY